MADSKSKKKLKHKLRQKGNDGFDPRMKRGTWGSLNPITKIKPNKKRDFLDEELDCGG